MGNASSDCKGNHPGEIRELKDNIGSRSDYMLGIANNIDPKIEKFFNLTKELKQSVTTIKTLSNITIPTLRNDVIFWKNDQTERCENEIKNLKQMLEDKSQKLNDTKDHLSSIQAGIGSINKTIISQTGGVESFTTTIGACGEGDQKAIGTEECKTEFIRTLNDRTYRQIHDTITTENDAINNNIELNTQLYSADYSKTNISLKNLKFINSVKFWLYFIYYFLLIYVIYVFIYKKMNIYYKIATILIMILYPLFIYNIQYYFTIIWSIIYSFLRITPPENM
jgi:hypothetical protein